ncbi:MAG: hypothetical protein H6587_09850 [Flavobacteriales bacterium]|nr:hypothetical protein [Flavobacteriales bacterium]
MPQNAKTFVVSSFEEFINENVGENNILRSYIAKTVKEFLLEQQEEEEAHLRMEKNLEIIKNIWKEGAIQKLRDIANKINHEIVYKGGRKIGRTCLTKEGRLTNYHGAGDNYKDLAIVIDDITDVDLIKALEGFFIDYFMIIKLVELDNSDGQGRGQEECKDSVIHKLYVCLG